MFNDKRGQGLSTSAIILIILGVFILVILIIGFMTGWKMFGNLFNSDNVDDIVVACQNDCSLENTFSYCSSDKTLRAEGIKYEGSCYTFATADGFENFNIGGCSAINCEESVECASWAYTKDGEDEFVKVGTVFIKDNPDEAYCKIPTTI